MGYLFIVVSVVSGLIALGLGLLAALAGLYVVCDFAEEYPSIFKRVLQKLCYMVICTMIVLYLFDSMTNISVFQRHHHNRHGIYDSSTAITSTGVMVPFLPACITIASHTLYLKLILGKSSFPIVHSAFSVSILSCFIITLVSHFIWFHHFIQTQKALYMDFYQTRNHYTNNNSNNNNTPPLIASAWTLIGFFTVFVWIVPLGLFVSMTLQEDCLPSSSSSISSSYANNSTTYNISTPFNTSQLYQRRSNQQQASDYYNTTSSSSSSPDSSHYDLPEVTIPSYTPNYYDDYSGVIGGISTTRTESAGRGGGGGGEDGSKNRGMLMKQLLQGWIPSSSSSNKKKNPNPAIPYSSSHSKFK